MRDAEKETHDFGHPCWTADDIAGYTGPIFRASVTWTTSEGHLASNDHECPSMKVLHRCIGKQVAGVCGRGGTVLVVTYGKHTSEVTYE